MANDWVGLMRACFKNVGLVAVLWGCVAVVGYVRYLPPSPEPADAAASRFSAHRALPLLESLVGDGRPHPVGSEQNRIVRDRIAAHLREFGYTPTVHRTTLGDGTVVENVLARLDNPTSDAAVALVAHYDSVEGGPGASDDGVGVAAILEVARMLKARPPSRNDVIFLLSDGEEYGTLGAEAFLQEHPWAGDVRVVLNFDARGTSGPSLMFQTSDGNAWLIEALAQSLTRPVTSSVFVEVYRHLPSYTDFTAFRDREIQGLDFAFIRGVEHYHTVKDDFEHVTPASLQHHGDNAWQLTGTLMDMDIDEKRSGDAVYTDLFALIVLWWDVDTGRIWATAMPGLFCVVVWVYRPRTRLRARRLMLTIIGCALIFTLTGAVGWFVDTTLRDAGWFESPWSPLGLLAISVYWMAMAGASVILAALLLRKTDAWTTWVSIWGCWSVACIAAAWVFPGGSYLLLLPFTGSLAGAVVVRPFSGNWGTHATGVWLSLIGTTFAGCVWLPQQFLLYDAVGLEFGVVFVLGIAVLLLTALPLFAMRAENDVA